MSGTSGTGGGAQDDPVDPFTEAAWALCGSEDSPEFVVEAARRMILREFGEGSDAKLVAAIRGAKPDAPLPDDVQAIAKRLLVILYTGETEGPDKATKVLGHYPWALAWSVLRFAKAPSICGAGFGSWSKP